MIKYKGKDVKELPKEQYEMFMSAYQLGYSCGYDEGYSDGCDGRSYNDESEVEE